MSLTVRQSNPPAILADSFNALDLPDGVYTTETGLIFSREITVEEWERVGVQLGKFGRALFWWIGDWLIYGKNIAETTDETRALDRRNLKRAEYGMLKKMGNILGYTPGYLSDIRNTCLRVKLGYRSDNLTGSHSMEILKHVPDAQFPFWSKRVIDENLSVRDLRGKLRDHNRTEPLTPQTTRPTMFAQKTLTFLDELEKEMENWGTSEWVSYASMFEKTLKAFRQHGF